ncbi:diguanylate cyclase [Actinoplanes derwentensis]|uniref:Diguanylate cyclase (GGDEF) domain-containing protein n=1 Tax=Actinoplanes derwentensis TaxID=113562 RepID=A0A1H1YVL3_9ACTN|nr:diguanylate cyclase [Actinoplanes derwentensis]GID81310.1 hypothetical protein Ade03nite_02340 [Actinoplanes derwentensis]SDT25423.1 diguanylate cyclase (GGDEF) domain-containing protein [Actinoplanes derwentensis]
MTEPSPVVPGLSAFQAIGRGGQSVVHRARRADGTDVAVKILLDPSGRARLRREATWMAACRHPGLPEVYDTGETDGQPYLVMEFVAGDRLGDLLRSGPLAPERAAAIAADIAEALTVLHVTGVVHRDIKPDNIIVGPDGAARLVDLGFATWSGQQSGEAVAGTLTYAPPEQNGTLQRPVDARSDLYALGIVLYESLTGHPPFQASDAGELLRQHTVAVPKLGPDLPPTLSAVVARLLAKDPDDRYAGAPGLVADLRLLADDPDAVFEIGATDAPVHRPEAPMVGRDAEIAELAALWGETSDQCRAAVIRGGAGSGRTRLLREFTGRLENAGVTVLRGDCRPGDAPLAVLSRIFDAHLEQSGPDLVRAAAGDAAAYLGRLSPALRDIFGAGDGGSAFMMAVTAFLGDLAEQTGGLVLALDNAQWLDVATLQMLRQLTQSSSTPLLIVATLDGIPGTDDDTEKPTVEGQLPNDAAWAGSEALTLQLRPLDRSALAQLLATYTGGYPLATELLDRLGARAGGLPLTALMLSRAAIEAGLLYPRDGHLDLDVDGFQRITIPTDLAGLMLERIDALGSEGRELLATAAVTGFHFDPEKVARIAAADPDQVRASCEAAVGQGLLERNGEGYGFVHEQVHRTLLAGLSPELLRDLHQRAADEASSSYAEARHLLQGHPELDAARTTRVCLAAAHAALEEHAGTDAIGFLEAAEPYLSADADTEADVAWTEALGMAYAQTGRIDEARQRFAVALAATADATVRSRLHGRLAQLNLGGWQLTAAMEETGRGLAALGLSTIPGGVVGLVTAIVYLLAAVLVERTGLGFGTADEERLARYRQRYALYAAGSYAALLATRRDTLTGYEMRARYVAARMGLSPEYARQAAHNAAIRHAVTRRPVARAFVRAQRIAEQVGQPAALVYVEYLRRLCETQSGHPDLDEYQRWLQRHGPLLDTTENLNFALALSSRWYLQGRVIPMRAAFAQGMDHLWSGDRSDHPTGRVRGLSWIGGRPPTIDDATAVLEQDDPAGHDAGSRLMSLAGALEICRELHDYGTTFDRAATELSGLMLRPARIAATMRVVYSTVAFGRLEQLRTATPEQRPAALAAARHAVRQLRAAAGPGRGVGRQLTAHHAVAAAHLAWLSTGDVQRQLAEADRQLAGEDLPGMTMSLLLLRARMAVAGTKTEEATTLAEAAGRLADQLGQARYARAVRQEFGLTIGQTSQASVIDGGAADRRRLGALERLSRTLSGVVSLDALSRAVLDETVLILNAERAYLFLMDEADSLQPHSGRDAGGSDLEVLTDYGSTIVDRVRHTGKPVVVTGTEEGAALGSQSVVLHGLRSIMAAPLVMDGRLLGVVYLDSRVAKGMFTSADVGILTAITQYVAAAVETARAAQLAVALGAAEQQRDMAETLRESLIRFSRLLEPAAILDELRDTLARVLPAEHTYLITASDDGDLTGPAHGAQGPLERTPVLNQLLAAPGPLVVGHLHLPFLDPASKHLVVPLHRQETQVGLVVLAGPEPFGPTEITLAAAIAEEAMMAYHNADLFAQVRYMATTDALTGVSNRRHFFTVAHQAHADAREAGRGFVAVMIDIDHFKQINDQHGHQAGDQVIATVAARLRDALPDDGELGRYGGEEFAAVWSVDGDRATAAERLRRAVTSTPIETDAGPLTVTVSVGVCPADPSSIPLDTALGSADAALYRAKAAGRNRVVLTDTPQAAGKV